jgi:hypothetical protein
MDDSTVFRPPREPLVPPGGADLHTRDMTATFAADVTLGAAQEKLRRHNQWLPIDGDEDATLGHLIDTNSTGPLRLGYGAWRDLLLGVQFSNGQGELITAGGRTVKNVAGYDLTKFMVGAWGVFGKLTTITTRTYRRPTAALLATTPVDASAVLELMATPCRPHWALTVEQHLLLGYLGDEQAIRFYESALRRYEPVPLLWLKMKRQAVGEDISLRHSHWAAHLPPRARSEPTKLLVRASLPPATLHALDYDMLESWAADPAFGIVVGACKSDWEPDFVSVVRENGGTLILYGSDGRPTNLRADPVALTVLKRLKSAFDPEGNLPPLPLKPL